MEGSSFEGPYRDLGSGFVRLAGSEGARRAPSRIRTVEDALAALVRNARDAGAASIFVASSLKARRYRTLTVIDDGPGVPATFTERIFEPGVTSRHLDPAPPTDTHGAGLSLYHIKAASRFASVLSNANPTAIQAVFDTQTLPERSLQTKSSTPTNLRLSRSNLPATLKTLITTTPRGSKPNIYYSSPSRILATLLQTHIIRTIDGKGIRDEAGRLGLEVSLRTVQRVLSGAIGPARPLGGGEVRKRSLAKEGGRAVSTAFRGVVESSGAELRLGEREIRKIQAILEGAARASYLEVGPIRTETRAGRIVLRASVYEPEEIYDD